MKTRYLLWCLLFAFAYSCTSSQNSQPDWLLGLWKNETKKGVIFESWSKEGEQEYKGVSFIVKDRDTTILETIQLLQEDNEMYYIPTVNTQNNAKPVHFLASKNNCWNRKCRTISSQWWVTIVRKERKRKYHKLMGSYAKASSLLWSIWISKRIQRLAKHRFW